jgi:hypothetical protein
VRLREGNRSRPAQQQPHPARAPGTGSMTAERPPTSYRADDRRTGPDGRYTHAVGLLVPCMLASAPPHLLDGWAEAVDTRWVELPRDLPHLAGRRGPRLDGDGYRHRVALVRSDGGLEWLEHRCADNGQAHAPAGHDSWGDTGHEAYHLAYSLLSARLGGPLDTGSAPEPRQIFGAAFAALFDVIGMLPRAYGWRVAWDQVVWLDAEPGGWQRGWLVARRSNRGHSVPRRSAASPGLKGPVARGGLAGRDNATRA